MDKPDEFHLPVY